MSESTSFWKDGFRKLRRNPLAMGSLIVLILIIGMILIVPHVVPYSYSQIITVMAEETRQPPIWLPSSTHNWSSST